MKHSTVFIKLVGFKDLWFNYRVNSNGSTKIFSAVIQRIGGQFHVHTHTKSSSSHIQYTPGGLIYKPGGTNMHHVTSTAFLFHTYANYLSRTS